MGVANRAQLHSPETLEEWLVQLVRLGSAGDARATQQVARRLLRRPPPDVRNVERFRADVAGALTTALTTTPPGPLLRAVSPEEIPVDRESGLSLARYDDTPADPPVLDSDSQAVIDAFLDERNRSDELVMRGMLPSRSILILGPPGTGKTMTARHVARSLDIPLLTIDLASVMSSYLGKTGQNLRVSLDFARNTRCALFLDEFDALAKRRDDASDIGELKRLVNVLLLELERWPAHAVVLAASNHPELLDRAVSRRFDRILHLPLPGMPEREGIISRLVDQYGDEISEGVLRAAVASTDGWTGSDIVRLLTDAARKSVLQNDKLERCMVDSLRPYLRTAAGRSREVRDELCRTAQRDWGLSNRAIAEMLGITHPTVARALRASRTPERGLASA